MTRHSLFTTLMLLGLLAPATSAFAFCGFYVGKADTKLYNQASQVVIVRHDDKTVLTMSNDFKGNPKEFAIVIPVPTILEREQIHVGDQALIDHLDAYTSPRLVEYFDQNPCMMRLEEDRMILFGRTDAAAPMAKSSSEKSRGVTIEATYTVGEYDILILSAKQSKGLETWLQENGYKIPKGASRILKSYLKQGMKFFVARVNLEEQSRLGFANLRPIQVAFESPKFMLPIRLGMINAKGPQELFIYTLTKNGRVETTNYRTVKLPTGMELPIHVKNDFGPFYKEMFTHQTNKERHRVLFTEYAWDMNWCDPCAAAPLSREELRQLGVFWLNDMTSGSQRNIVPRRPVGGAQQVFVTRLHVRYDAEHFPEDLIFQETADKQNFQARYVLRHPWSSEDDCSGAETIAYRKQLRERQEREAQTLASLTGWNINDIRKKIDFVTVEIDTRKWYQNIWN